VICDMDGVLLDSEPIYDESALAFLAGLGHQATVADLEPLRGTTASGFWQAIAAKFPLSLDVSEILRTDRERLDRIFATHPQVVAMPGALDLLDRLAEYGCELALASSTPENRVTIILHRLGMLDRFRVIVTGSDVSKGKPDPEIFLAAATRLGRQPADCVVIEDSRNGVLAAKAAGMKCVGFKTACSRQDLSAADVVVDCFAPLTYRLLNELRAKPASVQQ
jgi:HAD superfamily hydrolase (TIGR01509 family)